MHRGMLAFYTKHKVDVKFRKNPLLFDFFNIWSSKKLFSHNISKVPTPHTNKKEGEEEEEEKKKKKKILWFLPLVHA